MWRYLEETEELCFTKMPKILHDKEIQNCITANQLVLCKANFSTVAEGDFETKTPVFLFRRSMLQEDQVHGTVIERNSIRNVVFAAVLLDMSELSKLRNLPRYRKGFNGLEHKFAVNGKKKMTDFVPRLTGMV
jgi:hypothetical protein